VLVCAERYDERWWTLRRTTAIPTASLSTSATTIATASLTTSLTTATIATTSTARLIYVVDVLHHQLNNYYMSDSRPESHWLEERTNSKNPKNSKSFSNFFEMLKLNKQWSGGKSSDKESSIQTVKERLLREAYQLQIEQDEFARELK